MKKVLLLFIPVAALLGLLFLWHTHRQAQFDKLFDLAVQHTHETVQLSQEETIRKAVNYVAIRALDSGLSCASGVNNYINVPEYSDIQQVFVTKSRQLINDDIPFSFYAKCCKGPVNLSDFKRTLYWVNNTDYDTEKAPTSELFQVFRHCFFVGVRCNPRQTSDLLKSTIKDYIFWGDPVGQIAAECWNSFVQDDGLVNELRDIGINVVW